MKTLWRLRGRRATVFRGAAMMHPARPERYMVAVSALRLQAHSQRERFGLLRRLDAFLGGAFATFGGDVAARGGGFAALGCGFAACGGGFAAFGSRFASFGGTTAFRSAVAALPGGLAGPA